mgnify:CR=1 FL=1
MDLAYFNSKKEKALAIYSKRRTIFNPYLQTEVVLNSDGFHHLQFSDRRERSKDEQLLKFNLLPLALDVIKRDGTVQEYRKSLTKIGKTSSRDGMSLTKSVQYWGFVAIVGDSKIKIRTIVRRVGDGNFIFWSGIDIFYIEKRCEFASDTLM